MAEIISIECLGFTDTEEYVYDLETNDGTFSTQDGLILKNTDSCYVMFDVDKDEYPDDDSSNCERAFARCGCNDKKRYCATCGFGADMSGSL